MRRFFFTLGLAAAMTISSSTALLSGVPDESLANEIAQGSEDGYVLGLVQDLDSIPKGIISGVVDKAPLQRRSFLPRGKRSHGVLKRRSQAYEEENDENEEEEEDEPEDEENENEAVAQ